MWSIAYARFGISGYDPRIPRKLISPEISHSILGTELNVIKSATDLGVIISNDLKWTGHITSVVAKANRMMDLIRRNCVRDLKRDLVKTLYLLLVRSHLCYASQLWVPRFPTLMVEIENILHRATRFYIYAKILACLTKTSIRTELTSPEILAGITRHCLFI